MSWISAVALSVVRTVGVMLYVLYRTEVRVDGAMIGREDSREEGISSVYRRRPRNNEELADRGLKHEQWLDDSKRPDQGGIRPDQFPALLEPGIATEIELKTGKKRNELKIKR